MGILRTKKKPRKVRVLCYEMSPGCGFKAHMELTADVSRRKCPKCGYNFLLIDEPFPGLLKAKDRLLPAKFEDSSLRVGHV